MLAGKSISKKRLFRLAAIYGPFVRFFPGGSEGAGDNDDVNDGPGEKISDAQATTEAIKDNEPKVEDTPQFRGLLRDKQTADSRAQAAEAQAAAYRLELEKIEAAKAQQKPAEPELSEEELNAEVTRGEVIQREKGLVEKITKSVTAILDERESKNRASNTKNDQATDARNLMKTHTEKAMGTGLDAKTVVDETIAYLKQNDPDLLEALTKKSNFASTLYKYGRANVPAIAERVTLRQNTLLAEKFNQEGDDVPGGDKRAMAAFSEFEALMTQGAEETTFSS